jgi:hypothetical protein
MHKYYAPYRFSLRAVNPVRKIDISRGRFITYVVRKQSEFCGISDDTENYGQIEVCSIDYRPQHKREAGFHRVVWDLWGHYEDASWGFIGTPI